MADERRLIPIEETTRYVDNEGIHFKKGEGSFHIQKDGTVIIGSGLSEIRLLPDGTIYMNGEVMSFNALDMNLNFVQRSENGRFIASVDAPVTPPYVGEFPFSEEVAIDGVPAQVALAQTGGTTTGVEALSELSDATIADLKPDQVLAYDGNTGSWVNTTFPAGVTDHGLLSGLTDDDHSGYAWLAGRAGGQTLIGGTASGNDLTLQSTSHATKGRIAMGTSAYDEVNNRLGIGTISPSASLHIKAGTTAANTAPIKLTSGNLLTNPEAGTIEFLSDAFYATITTGPTRKTIAFVEDLGSGYLKLDQTTPQEIDNGAPTFNEGLIIKAGEKIYFDG